MSSEMNRIITEIYKDPKYYGCCRNISKGEGIITGLVDDLFQESLLIICNQKEELIIDLFQKNELINFFARIVSNQWNSSSKNAHSPFYKKYRKENKEHIRDWESGFKRFIVKQNASLNDGNGDFVWDLQEVLDSKTDKQFTTEDKLINRIGKSLEVFTKFDKEIFTLYIEDNHTFSSLAKEVGLSRNVISDSIQRTKDYLAKELGIPRTKKYIY